MTYFDFIDFTQISHEKNMGRNALFGSIMDRLFR